MGGSQSSWDGYESQLLHDEKSQAYFIPDSAEEGTTAVMRNPAAKDGFPMYLKDDSKEDLDTGWKAFEYSVKKFKDLPALGWRPFTDPSDLSKRGEFIFDTYNDFYEDVLSFANGLNSLGLRNETEEVNVGIYAKNRPEWVTAHFANLAQSFRTVALYDTLGAQAVNYIVDHAELPVIVVEKDKLKNLWEAVEASSEKTLKYVVQMDFQDKYVNPHEAVDDSDREKAESFGLKLLGFSEVLKMGTERKELKAPTSEDLAYIMYTSGTTGDPKGVMLTHRGFACVVSTSYRALALQQDFGGPLGPDDRHLSFLPLAHIFEAVIISVLTVSGSRIAFHQGDIRKISLDWQSLRPTVLFGVPRIFNKTYDKVNNQASSAGWVKNFIFNKAKTASTTNIRHGGARSSMYDGLVWNKVAVQIGFDQIRFVLSGAAPLPPHTAEFLRIVCSKAFVTQGYGLTETTASAFVSLPGDLNLGHVGIPFDNMEMRLVDAPECEYSVKDKPFARGEIQLRGPLIMAGYYKNEEATKKAVSSDGWFSTGDIGRINPNGTLSIIDRRKNMFKTSLGEYIASEKIETIYTRASSVGQIWVYGNSFKSFIVAVVVPDGLWLTPLLKAQGIWPSEDESKPGTQEYADKFTEVVGANIDTVKKLVAEDMKSIFTNVSDDTDEKTTKTTKLKKFEKIKDVFIEHRIDVLMAGFNMENGTLTPTFKKKRPQLFKRYVDDLKKLYTDNGEAPRDDEHW